MIICQFISWMWLLPLLHIPNTIIVLLYQIHYRFPVILPRRSYYTKWMKKTPTLQRHQCSMTRNNQNQVSLFFQRNKNRNTLWKCLIKLDIHFRLTYSILGWKPNWTLNAHYWRLNWALNAHYWRLNWTLNAHYWTLNWTLLNDSYSCYSYLPKEIFTHLISKFNNWFLKWKVAII